jgi:hypothetical protein
LRLADIGAHSVADAKSPLRYWARASIALVSEDVSVGGALLGALDSTLAVAEIAPSDARSSISEGLPGPSTVEVTSAA